MSQRTLLLALHCSMSISLHSLIILLKWLSIAMQMTNRFVALMILFSSNLYSILQSSSNKFQEWKLVLNYSRYIYILASFLFCEVELGLPISIGKLSIKVKWKKSGRSGLLFNQHMKKNISDISFSLSCIPSSLKQDFNSSLHCIFSVL